MFWENLWFALSVAWLLVLVAGVFYVIFA